MVEPVSNQAAAEEMLLAMSPAFESGKPRGDLQQPNSREAMNPDVLTQIESFKKGNSQKIVG